MKMFNLLCRLISPTRRIFKLFLISKWDPILLLNTFVFLFFFFFCSVDFPISIGECSSSEDLPNLGNTQNNTGVPVEPGIVRHSVHWNEEVSILGADMPNLDLANSDTYNLDIPNWELDSNSNSNVEFNEGLQRWHAIPYDARQQELSARANEYFLELDSLLREQTNGGEEMESGEETDVDDSPRQVSDEEQSSEDGSINNNKSKKAKK